MWFETHQINDHIYIIRERLDKIESRFRTEYTNNYLIIGEERAILFDTGSGVESIKKEIERIINKKEVLVINSHSHFDHVLGNNEFEEVYIHRFDLKNLMKRIDISYLSFQCENYSKNEYKISSSEIHIPLVGEEIFDLGNFSVKVIFTPGHSNGSICLMTDMKELFSGDTVHYGSVYLPERMEIDKYLSSLELLNDLNAEYIYPAHEDYNPDCSIINKLIYEIKEIYSIIFNPDKNETLDKSYDKFLDAFVLESDKFTFIIPKQDQDKY